jgi:hypothetical protein
LKQQGRLR